MGEQPMGTPPVKKPSYTWVWFVAGGAALLVALGVVAILLVGAFLKGTVDRVSESLDDFGETAHAPAPPEPVQPTETPERPAGTTGVKEIGGTGYSVQGTMVVTSCYAFDLPTVIDYEVNPDSASCQIAIRALGDSLTEIDILPQKGDNSIDGFFTTLGEAMATSWPDKEFSTETIIVDGREAGVAHAVNSLGISADYYMIPINEGVYESAGTPITSILVTGPAYADVDAASVLPDILASLVIAD